MTDRRAFLTGITGFIVCAPAIVRASSLMKLPAPKRFLTLVDWAEQPYQTEQIAKLLAECNDALDDLVFKRADLHQQWGNFGTMLLTKLPTQSYRSFAQT